LLSRRPLPQVVPRWRGVEAAPRLSSGSYALGLVPAACGFLLIVNADSCCLATILGAINHPRTARGEHAAGKVPATADVVASSKLGIARDRSSPVAFTSTPLCPDIRVERWAPVGIDSSALDSQSHFNDHEESLKPAYSPRRWSEISIPQFFGNDVAPSDDQPRSYGHSCSRLLTGEPCRRWSDASAFKNVVGVDSGHFGPRTKPRFSARANSSTALSGAHCSERWNGDCVAGQRVQSPYLGIDTGESLFATTALCLSYCGASLLRAQRIKESAFYLRRGVARDSISLVF